LRPDEIDSEGEEPGAYYQSLGFLLLTPSSKDEDDDVVMPEGPPPGAQQDEQEDSDDDIPMPEGPPPQEGESESNVFSPSFDKLSMHSTVDIRTIIFFLAQCTTTTA